MAGDKIRQSSGVLDNRHGNQRLRRDLLTKLYPFLELMNDAARQRFHFHGAVDFIFMQDDRHLIVIFQRRKIAQLRPANALNQHTKSAARHFQELTHFGDCADIIKIVAFRLVHIGIALRAEQNPPVLCHRPLQSRHGAFPPRVKMNDHIRKDDHAPQRQKWHLDCLFHPIFSFPVPVTAQVRIPPADFPRS